MNFRRADRRSRRDLSARQQQQHKNNGVQNLITSVVVVTSTADDPDPTNRLLPPVGLPVPHSNSGSAGGTLSPSLAPGHSSSGNSASSSHPVNSNTFANHSPTINIQPSATSSSPSGTPTLSSNSNTSSSTTTGSVFGGLLAIAAFVGLVVYAVRYYRKKSSSDNEFNASHFRRSGLALHDSPKYERSGLPPPGPPLRRTPSPRMVQAPAVPPATFPYAGPAQYGVDPYGQYAASANQYNVSSDGADGQITRRISMDASGVNISGATYGQHASYSDPTSPGFPVPDPQNPFVNQVSAVPIMFGPGDRYINPIVSSETSVHASSSPFITPPGSPNAGLAQTVQGSPLLNRHSIATVASTDSGLLVFPAAPAPVAEATPVLTRRSTASVASTLSDAAAANVPEANYIEVQRDETSVSLANDPDMVGMAITTPEPPVEGQVSRSASLCTAAGAIVSSAVRVPVSPRASLPDTPLSNIDHPTRAISIAPAASIHTADVPGSPTPAAQNDAEVRPVTMYDDADAYGGY